ncbi:unnamed protein product [Acanthoscelides obtectus]|uniref:PiggyBac transposable element-derived protein domain-containing protein n=1 Tax=Acanthoscelides obtectus TaxID=200917 RepID=A0A9P0KEY4_ACAOB|nr:unnamed protein product [Acanthoscelides obtectus]CAK1680149.1 PiggyBac transposable element-derived protein 2 [Acanthoscelides obtectus]
MWARRFASGQATTVTFFEVHYIKNNISHMKKENNSLSETLAFIPQIGDPNLLSHVLKMFASVTTQHTVYLSSIPSQAFRSDASPAAAGTTVNIKQILNTSKTRHHSHNKTVIMSRRRLIDTEIARLLGEITDDQAEDSELDGDSDAEDFISRQPLNDGMNLACEVRYVGGLRGRNAGQQNLAEYSDDDFEENTDDPDYSNSPKPSRKIHNTSSEENSGDDSGGGGDPKLYSTLHFSEPGAGAKNDVDMSSPFKVLQTFWTLDIFTFIVTQSNLYATQNGVDLSMIVDELRAMLGMLIFMGFDVLPTFRSYWSKDDNFHVERIARVMSQKRFLKLLRYLHLNDNLEMLPRTDPNYDRLFKMTTRDSDFVQSGDISIRKWRDRGKKSVVVVSSMHNPSKQRSVLRTKMRGERESVNCPESIADYNTFMGGVDKFDQLMSTYSIAQKSRRWWLKLFYYFIDMAIVNSYVMDKDSAKKQRRRYLSHLEFRSQLVNETISSFCSRKRKGYCPGAGVGRKNINQLVTLPSKMQLVCQTSETICPSSKRNIADARTAVRRRKKREAT